MAETKKKTTTKKPTRKTKTVVKPVEVSPELVIPTEPTPPELEPETITALLIEAPEADLQLYKQPVLLVVIALLLGWFFDFLFRDHPLGVNFAIFILLCLLGGIAWLLSNKLKPSWKSLWLLIPLVCFAVVTFLRQEFLTVSLAFTFSLLSIGLFGSSYLGGRWPQYSLLDYIYKFFLFLLDMFSAGPRYFYKSRQVQAQLGSNKSGIPVWGLLRGLLIALPIVICFGSLLAAGDLVFKQKVDDFLDLDSFSENVWRAILILVYAYFLCGAFVHAALKSRDEYLAKRDKPRIKPFLGFAESTVIFGSVSLLFLIFVIVQFQYFFGGETNIGVEGYTYSQYARRGFNELVTVAFFSLVLILGLSSLSRRDNEMQRRTYSILSITLVALVIVILISAYQRISLAIDWHGYSRLRLYPRIFLVWLGLLLITVAVLELVRRERYFAFAAVLASVGFAVSLTLFNVDAAIVKHNVPRTLQGKTLNVAHLASLSPDAVPALAEEFYSNAYSKEVHEGIGAALTCYLNEDSQYEKSTDDWRSFNLSLWQAHATLQNAEKDLQDYGVNAQRYWSVKVRTPSNVWYECTYYSGAEEDL